MTATSGAYERYAYPGYAYALTHPARVEALARLFGLSPATAAACRVLEIGCGDGANLLSMAATLPASDHVGIDSAAAAIGRGEALRTAAGLTNAALLERDIEALGDDLGSFDYIIAHGVYSWITPRARSAMLAAIERMLAPEGVAYVSYNAYPGSYLRDMTRDILLFHLQGLEDPAQRLAGAQALMQTIVSIEDPSPYARILREQMERTLRYSDPLLVHDDLAEVSTPFYFHEFVEHAAAHGLAFLCEASLAESQMRDVPLAAEKLMAQVGDDVIAREQYLDFFRNRGFRRTLLCHAGAPVKRALSPEPIREMWVSAAVARTESAADAAPGAVSFLTGEGIVMTAGAPLVVAAMDALGTAWPQDVQFGELFAVAARDAPAGAAEASEDSLLDPILQAYAAGVLELRSTPAPLRARAAKSPRVSPLARAQLAAGADAVSTLRHTMTSFAEPGDRALAARLDGTRDTSTLARETATAAADIDAAVARIALLGLLETRS